MHSIVKTSCIQHYMTAVESVYEQTMSVRRDFDKLNESRIDLMFVLQTECRHTQPNIRMKAINNVERPRKAIILL